MRIINSIFNVSLVAIGGILGNLISGWIQQDLLENSFPHSQVIGTIAGLVLVILLLSFMDASQPQGDTTSTDTGIRRNVQFGNSIIRVIKGTNVIGNIQIGKSIIEVRHGDPDRDMNQDGDKDAT